MLEQRDKWGQWSRHVGSSQKVVSLYSTGNSIDSIQYRKYYSASTTGARNSIGSSSTGGTSTSTKSSTGVTRKDEAEEAEEAE